MNPIRTSLLVLALTGGCKLQLRTSTSSPSSPHTTSRASSENARFAPAHGREPAFDDRAYKACVTAFDANYDAWLPVDRDAKAALAKVKDKSPYLAVPALLSAYEAVDAKAVPRQTGTIPAGAIYAPATRLELATALVELAARTHAGSCVNNQFRVEVDNEYLPPLTGDRARDKVMLCGGPSADERTAWLDARRTAVEAFNVPNIAIHDDHTVGGTWSQVASFASSAKEATLSITAMSGNRRCVKNGRYGHQPDGSWGPLCDWEELPAYSVGDAKAYHFAPQELPFKLKKGDHITLAYELDPDAPASSEKVARRGGWWWLTSVSRGDKTVFEDCGTATAHQVEINSTLRPLQIITRKD